MSAQPTLSGFSWSTDGRTLAAIEDDGLRVTSVRLIDGESGDLRAELSVDRLTAAFGGDPPLATDLAVVVGPRGARVACARGGSWVVWEVATGEVVRADALTAATAMPIFSPTGDQLAFTTQSGLTLLELADLSAKPIALASRDEPWLAWSPDGRYLAVATGDESGQPRIAVVDPLAPEPRLLDSGPLDMPLRARWRLDGGALGLAIRAPDGESVSLALCHPDRLYCRALAVRNDPDEAPSGDDFRLLDDGFLWRPVAGDGALAFFDTLGRQRRAVLPSGLDLIGLVALFRESREVIVGAAGEGGAVRLLLVGTRGGTVREIASGMGWPPAAISESLRAWVRPRKDAEGGLEGYVLEKIDGTPIRLFTVNGSPIDR